MKSVAALLLCLAASIANAQDWPQRTLHIIVPFPPASTPDTFARLLAENLRKRLEHPVIVENRPGASGMLGTDAVAKAAPDGYTIGVSIVGPLVSNKLLYKSMPYDPDRDLLPITLAVVQASLLVVPAYREISSLDALITYLKARPGEHNYASVGVGSLSHLTMELVALRSGTDIVHVPYPGSGQALRALLAGDVDMACLPAASVLSQVRAGNLRVIGATTAKRSALLPDIPTLKEQGLRDVDAGAWIGIVAPAGTPSAIADRLHHEIVAALNDPDVVLALRRQVMEVVASTPEEFVAQLHAERERWSAVIRQTRITLD